VNGADLDDEAFPPAGAAADPRYRSFGQGRRLTVADRLGRWLSTRRVRRAVGPVPGRAVADIGCGYHADLSRVLFGRAGQLLLVDVRVDPRWQHDSRVTIIEGLLPAALAEVGDGTLDVVLANNVVEHLWEPELALHEMRRLLRPGGALIVNVPTWWGKRFLELAAFRLRLAPAEEMNDHKTYYDPRDLWPLLVRAGFRPDRIVCRRHKLGLNTIAICRR
jgi:SAM-dependent methyltransferase